MKKLFLYITLLALVFIIAYSIAEDYFYNDTKNNKLTATELIDNNEEDNKNEVVDDKTQPLQSEISGNSYEEGAALNAITTEETVDAINSSVINNTTNYIVTIKNGYIVVYENTVENIFEYTGIDAETIRVTDEEMYNKLNESLIFNTEEELFDFLQSIAG